MNDPNRIERLLGNDGSGNKDHEADLERRILMLIEKKRRQIHRIRIAVGVAWVVLAALMIAGGATEAVAGHGIVASSFAVVARAALLIAAILTVSWYVRSVSLRFDSIQQALAAIQDRLAQRPLEPGARAG